MYKNKTFLAIIPARGGSKRLLRKNMLDLAGKPLIAWSIKAGKASSYIDDVVVSSDDDEILKISYEYGSHNIKRPDELATDTSTTFDVIRHTIETIKKKYDYVVLLQPTSPLRTAEQIDKAIETLGDKEGDAIISICEMDHSPLWSNTVPEDGSLDNFIDSKIKNKRSQDLETYYRLNGAIYICKADRLLNEETFFIKDNIYSFKMDKESSVDIDTLFDFKLAELLTKERKK